MSQAETWTVRRLLEWTTSFFKEKGADSPRLEAEVLLADAMKTSRVELYVNFDSEPSEEVRANFRNLVKRRGLGEPVAYLVGKKEFYSLEFEVDSNVLIPRPETEQLVLEAVELVKKLEKSAAGTEDAPGNAAPIWRLCDVGTGSGFVAVALAKNLPNARLTAVDVQPGALAVAKKNAEKHDVADRIEFVESDLFAALGSVPPEESFDVVVGNPPYVSVSEYAELEPTVRDFEPKTALVGGETGTEIVARIVDAAPNYLKPGGKIYLEIGPSTAAATARLFENDPRWENVAVLRDFAQLERIVTATLKR